MAGRRPKPSALKKLGGERRPSRINPDEPSLAVLEPEMPADLTELGKAEWKRVVPILLESKVLSKLDSAALYGYCYHFAEWVALGAEIEEIGRRIETPIQHKTTGEIIGSKWINNPLYTVMFEHSRQCRAFAGELGLSPATRSRLRIEKPAAEVDPFESYLSGNATSGVM